MEIRTALFLLLPLTWARPAAAAPAHSPGLPPAHSPGAAPVAQERGEKKRQPKTRKPAPKPQRQKPNRQRTTGGTQRGKTPVRPNAKKRTKSLRGQQPAGAQPRRAQNARGANARAAVTPAQRPKRSPDSFEQALTSLERRALGGQATRADFEAATRALGEVTASEGTTGQRTRERLGRTIQDVERRAGNGSIGREDIAILREQWLDTRVDRSLDGLRQTAGTRSLSEADFGELRTLLDERAATNRAVDPGADASHKRIQGAVNRLEKRAGSGRIAATDFADLEGELANARLDRALSDLERRSLRKQASSADIERVGEAVDDQAKGPKSDPKLAEKLRRALADLEARALRGEVTPAEFAELRAGLSKRARNAAR